MILYENDNFIILNKKNGYASQGGINLDKNMFTLGNEYLSYMRFHQN
jgi:23S rRNA-/tRNA-specific pseudouridylate synthase